MRHIAHSIAHYHQLTPGVFLRRVQMFSQVNKMSAHNLAVVIVPTLFQSLNQDLLRLTREFIIHHTLLFLVNMTPELPCFSLRSGVSRLPVTTCGLLHRLTGST